MADDADERERLERERLEREQREAEERARREAVAAAVDGGVANAIMGAVVTNVVDAVREAMSPEVLAQMDRGWNEAFNPAMRAAMEMEHAQAATVNAEAERIRFVARTTREVMAMPAVVSAMEAANRETDAAARQAATASAAQLGADLAVIEARQFRPPRTPTMFRLIYREPRCRDCRAVSHRDVCQECGCMRTRAEDFELYVVPRFAHVRPSPSGPWPRLLGFTDFELYRIREAANAADDEEPNGEGWGGGIGDGYGFGNGDGFGGGYDPDGANAAFTDSITNEAADYFDADAAPEWAADIGDAAADDDAAGAAAADAPPWYEAALGDAEGDGFDGIAADPAGTLADFVVETFERR